MDRESQAAALEQFARQLRASAPPMTADFRNGGLVLRAGSREVAGCLTCPAADQRFGLLTVLSHLCRSGAVDEWGRVHGSPGFLKDWQRYLRSELANLLEQMAGALREDRLEDACRLGAVVLTVLRRVDGPVKVQDLVIILPELLALV